ncbi:MAG: dipeptide ABC transporter ATP-binding protein [Alphaproteobacteria bacterium]|nr:dipeptide ABC transporter ATP-binding protein [Alphaproteobacteria bacterium]
MSLLSVQNLTVTHLRAGRLVNGLSFDVDARESIGIVGESGSGKSLTALSIMGLLPQGMRASGSILFNGQELIGAPERALCDLRGDRMAMIFQEPMTALNPVHRIGRQVAEPLILHHGMRESAALEEAGRLLDRVRIPDAVARLKAYPHELSGGQRQRVMIAMALACRPALLIADEPTTALDVTTQAEILSLVRALAAEEDLALILITHDLGVVAQLCDRVLVMDQGEAVELGETRTLFAAPRHAKTRALVAAMREDRLLDPPSATTPLVEIDRVTRQFTTPRQSLFQAPPQLTAVDDVSLKIERGRNLGIVGESGSGKSTLARIVMALDRPNAGTVRLLGEDVFTLPRRKLRAMRRHIQMVFQDPYGSLDPRMTVERIVAEPLAALEPETSRAERRTRVAELLESVGLKAADGTRHPHAFSGGQRQRIAIARALITRPDLIVADEPVSALDLTIRAQVLRLMADLAERFGVTYLFISHDLSVVKALCAEVAVMREGRVVEQGAPAEIFSRPQHPYTQTLIDAVPALPNAPANVA